MDSNRDAARHGTSSRAEQEATQRAATEKEAAERSEANRAKAAQEAADRAKRDDATVARVGQQDRAGVDQGRADTDRTANDQRAMAEKEAADRASASGVPQPADAASIADRAERDRRSEAERPPLSMERSGPDVTAEAQAEATKAETERNAAAARAAAAPRKMDRTGFAKLGELTAMMQAKTDELLVLVSRVVDVVHDIERDRERR